MLRLVRKLLVGVPSELRRWLHGFKTLWGADALIVPGTGLLTDAYSLFHWGPYEMFRWSLTAKLCGCKLLLVSVGAGPIYSRIGRFCVKTVLRLSNFRSYRDVSTQEYLKSIGFPADRDPVYPDLAFSLPTPPKRSNGSTLGRRPVVGLGIMGYAGKYSIEKPTSAARSNYIKCFAELANWLLANNYDIRLLIGDVADISETREFRALLKNQLAPQDESRIIDEQPASVQDLLAQLASTDFVVATRFHNILLGLLLGKPAISISFHHKCSSLMSQMGLADYCLDINHLHADELIGVFRRLRENDASLRATIAEKVRGCRDALDEQYVVMLRKMWPKKHWMTMPASTDRLVSN